MNYNAQNFAKLCDYLNKMADMNQRHDRDPFLMADLKAEAHTFDLWHLEAEKAYELINLDALDFVNRKLVKTSFNLLNTEALRFSHWTAQKLAKAEAEALRYSETLKALKSANSRG